MIKVFDFLFNKKFDVMTDEEIILNEIKTFKTSRTRQDMFAGERYYEGKHDILSRKRTVIGQSGELEEVHNLPNNRIVDNQYRKMVNQKKNYLLAEPISLQCDNDTYAKLLKTDVFNKKFQKTIKTVTKDTFNCGIGWMYIYYNDFGELTFKRMKPHEIIPGWTDSEHTELDYIIRIYDVIVFEGHDEQVVTKVEVYTDKGIAYYELYKEELKPVEPYQQTYFNINNIGYNWLKIPFIPFKYNDEEIPLLNHVKSLQDGLNLIESNFQNQMEEDPRNTILVLVNYDGENLGEFRQNLAQYGAVKVRTIDGAGGDLRTLQVEVNSENYKVILDIFKKAIIENAMGYDAKDDRLNGNPNQMNIQSMYSDIDLAANDMETEYQASLEDLLWFVDNHFSNTGKGDFSNEAVDIIFNRNMLMSEAETIDNCGKSIGILSDETVIANHPWIDDPQAELERLKEQRMQEYDNAFNPVGDIDEE